MRLQQYVTGCSLLQQMVVVRSFSTTYFLRGSPLSVCSNRSKAASYCAGRQVERRFGNKLHSISTSSVEQTSGQIVRVDDSLLSWGGNYAGLLASFDGTTGELLPVPQHYVPRAFVEWGAIPTTLEVLSHESSSTDGRNRMQTLVLPEVGCGVDNLETIIAVEDVVESNPAGDAILPKIQSSRPLLLSATMMRKKRLPNKSICEAAFYHFVSEDEEASNYRCRVRVAVTENEPDFYDDEKRLNRHVDGEIQVILERLVPNQEHTSNIADTKSGGLDGASVARWLGTMLNSEKFRSFGTMELSHAHSTNATTLELPFNVTVTSATEGPWWLEISKNSCGTVRFDSPFGE